MSATKKISALIHSRIFNILIAIIIIGVAIYDIYTELFDLTHEHILIFMGILMIIRALNSFEEAVDRLVSKSTEKKLNRFFFFLHTKLAIVLMAIIIIVTSIYGLYEDIEKMITKSTSIFIGILLMIMPIISTVKGFQQIKVSQKE